MPTHFDQCDHDTDTTKKRNDPTAWPDERPWYLRLVHAYRRAGVWLGHRVHHTVQWAREQDRSMLAWFWGLAAVAVLLAYAALRLVATLVTGLWSWLFGDTDTAEPAPQPEAGSDVPGWIAGLDQQPLWTGLWDGITGWFAHQADMTGVPMMLLLISWGLAGVLLLLAAGYGGAKLAQDIPWWGWLAATCVLVWTHTPGHSPIPAVLVGTVGVVASTVPAVGLLLAFAGTGLGVLIAMH